MLPICVKMLRHYGVLWEACSPIYDVWKEAGREVFWTIQRDELIQFLNKLLKEGDSLLLKGSRANLLSELITELSINDFDVT